MVLSYKTFFNGISIGVAVAIIGFFIGISFVNAQVKPSTPPINRQAVTGKQSPASSQQNQPTTNTQQQPQVVQPTPSPWTAPKTTSTQAPVLEKPIPGSAGKGQYVTVEGTDLGEFGGEILFTNGKDSMSLKDDQYSQDCKGLWWRPNYIFVKIPESFQKGTYKFRAKRVDGVLSNEVSIAVTDTSAGPSICSVLPDNGPIGSAVRISGTQLGITKGKISFGKEDIQVQQSDWTQNLVTLVLPPLQSTSAKMRIVTTQQVMTNPIPFSTLRCSSLSCGAGDSCCSDGTCRPKGLCKDKPSLCSYGWSFYTGKLAALGEKCESNSQCLSTMCGPAKVCIRGDKNQNDSCKYDAECKEGLSCSGGVCKKVLREVGESCSFGTECFSGKCVNGTCGQGDKQLGAQCVYSQECLSGNCYKNVCAQSARCLQVEKIEPTGNTIPRNAVFVVTFNQLIDSDSVKDRVSLDPSIKGRLEVRTVGSGLKAQSQVVFRPTEKLSQQKKYHVVVDGDIKAAGSDNILKKCVTISSQGSQNAISSQDCKDRAQTTCQKRDGQLYCSDDPTCGNDRLVCSKENSCKMTDDCKLCNSCTQETRCRVTPPPPPDCKGKTSCQRTDGTFYCTLATCGQDHLVCKVSNRCTFGDDCKLCKPCAQDDRCKIDEKKDCGNQNTCKRPDGTLYCSDDAACGGSPQKLVCSQGSICLDTDECSLCAKCSTTLRCEKEKTKTCEQQGKLSCQASDGHVYCSDDKKCSGDDKVVCSLGAICLSSDSCTLCGKCSGQERCKNSVDDCPGKTTCKRTDGSSYCSDDASCTGNTLVCSAASECTSSDSCECQKCKNENRCKNNTLLSNEARCVSLDAPNEVVVNQDFQVTVKMKNTGTKTWHSDAHKLGTQDPQDNRFWVPGKNRIDLAKEVKSQETFDFTFQAKGYALPMTGPFSWRMVEEKVEWFGEECHKEIKVKLPPDGAKCNSNSLCEEGETCACGDCKDKKECKTPPPNDVVWNNAQCDLTLPQTIFAGGNFTAQATVRNTGTKTWSKDSYSLRSENPYENSSWGVSKVPLSRDVKPQETVDFQIPARAFSTQKEQFSFQMIEEKAAQKDWFGERCRDRIQGQGLEKPTNVRVTPDSNSLKVKLQWDDTNSSEDGYEIQRHSGGSDAFVTLTTTSRNAASYDDTAGLVGNTIYTYRIRAVRGVYVSDFSEEKQGTTYTNPGGPALLDGFNVFIGGVQKGADEFMCVSDSCTHHSYTIKAYSLNGSTQVEINPQSIEWLSNNINVLVQQVPSDKQQTDFEVSVKGVPFSGASISITVKGEQNRQFTKTIAVANIPCKNLWKYPSDPSQNFYDMQLSYCTGNDDDPNKRLPLLQSTPKQVQRSGFDEWFFPFIGNNDAIIVRAYTNPDWMSALRWYQDPRKNIGVGGPGSSEKDGFAAVQDGAGVYVSTIDMTQTPFKPLILYITINANASEATKQVYVEILKSPRFAASVLNVQGAENAKKLRLDVRRIFDLRDVASILDIYAESQHTKCAGGLLSACQIQYPDLEFGSYIRGQALSAWPLSWTTTLSNALSRALPQDPGTEKTAFGCTKNQDGTYTNCACNTNTYKPDTCWNETAQSFYKPSVEDAVSDSNVHAYSYMFKKRATPTGNDGYSVCAHLDYLSLTGQTGQKYCILK